MAGLVTLPCLTLNACFSNDPAGGEDTALVTDEGYVPVRPESPPGWPSIEWPADNAFTPAKAVLGRRLFGETQLSRTGTVSCLWCHHPVRAYSDKHGTSRSFGLYQEPTLRNAPVLANAAFAKHFLSEGNASSLEDQASGPLFNKAEMDMTGPEIVARLSADTFYVRLFRQAYGDGSITMPRVVRALATFERTFISARSPYDHWKAGEEDALSESAKRGAEVFFGKGKCASCHAPPLFTDGGFHNVGLDGVAPEDSGLFRTTRRLADIGKFKTPTLRNISVSSAYMHDGRFYTLEEVVAQFNAGGGSGRDSLLQPLGLNEYETMDLIEFLKSLTDIESLAPTAPLGF